MAEQPIRKEDIIDSAGIIKSMLDVVETIKSQLVPAIELINKTVKEEKVTLETLNPVLKEHQALIGQKAQTINSLNQEQKKNKQALTETEVLEKRLIALRKDSAIDNERLRQAISKQTKDNKDLVAVEGAHEGSLRKLRLQLEAAKKAFTDASPGQRGGITENLQKLDKEVKKLEATMGVHQRKVGDYTGALKKLGSQFLAVTGITAGFAGAIKFAKGVFEETDFVADKFEATIEGVKQGFNAVKRAVATLDFKDFMKNVKDAYNEGRRYAENLDSIDEKTRALQIAESEANIEYINQRVILNSATSSLKEKNDAGKRAIELEDKLALIRTGIAKQGYENEAKNIAQITGLTMDEVLAFEKQEPVIMSNIELGKKYNENIKARNDILLKVASLKNYALTEQETNKLNELNIAISKTNDETKRFAAAFIKMPGDEKMQLFTDKYVAYQNAIISAVEKTLRVRSKISVTEDKLNDEKLKSEDEVRAESVKNYLKELDDKKKANDDYAEEKWKFDLEYGKNIYEQNQKERDKIHKERLEQDKQDEEAAKQAADNEIKIERAKQETIANIAMSFIDIWSNILENKKQKEIKAAGENEALVNKIEREYANKKKAIAISQSIISGALGIARAWENPVTAPIITGLVIAATAAQIAVIASQKFAEGGEIKGKPHSQGGTIIEAEKGEYMINKLSVAKYKGLIEAINKDDKMAIVGELRNRKFHMVWGGVQENLKTVAKQDPYTQLTYELLKGRPTVYLQSDGSTVLDYGNGYKRIIRKYEAS